MIGKFIARRKKLIAALLAFYFLFFGGLILYASKMSTNKTSLETLINLVDVR